MVKSRSGLMSWLIFFASAIFLSGCQTPQPTVVKENPERKVTAPKGVRPVRVEPKTVVVDSRPAFDYSIARIPGSLHMNWSDFTEPQPAQRGILQADHFAIARRLASAGIGPETHVIVVGQGLEGNGEEGRIAWMLDYLGVKNVQFTDLDALKPRLTNITESNRPASLPVWKPEIDESLVVTRDELLHVINKRGVERPTAFRKGEPPVLYRIIDVREEKEYLGRAGFGAREKIPNMDAINIPWKQFFDEDLRPKEEIGAKLEAVGILPEHRIIVLGEEGVKSAAVTEALRELGFTQAGNYAGGLRDLMSRR